MPAASAASGHDAGSATYVGSVAGLTRRKHAPFCPTSEQEGEESRLQQASGQRTSPIYHPTILYITLLVYITLTLHLCCVHYYGCVQSVGIKAFVYKRGQDKNA